MKWIRNAAIAFGIIVGFMVAIGDSALAAAAVPVLVSIATATLAVLVPKDATNRFTESLMDSQSRRLVGAHLEAEARILEGQATALLNESRQNVIALGVAAFAFAIAYGGGFAIGSMAETTGWWAKTLVPLDVDLGVANDLDFDARADWLVYQQGLIKAGVPQDDIDNLYEAFRRDHRTMVLPWSEQEVPSMLVIAAWLYAEPRLSAAGMTNDQLIALWPTFRSEVEASQSASAQQVTVPGGAVEVDTGNDEADGAYGQQEDEGTAEAGLPSSIETLMALLKDVAPAAAPHPNGTDGFVVPQVAIGN